MLLCMTNLPLSVKVLGFCPRIRTVRVFKRVISDIGSSGRLVGAPEALATDAAIIACRERRISHQDC